MGGAFLASISSRVGVGGASLVAEWEWVEPALVAEGSGWSIFSQH